MTSDNWLFAFIVGVVALVIYFILTNTVSDEDRDAMLNDPEMWP